METKSSSWFVEVDESNRKQKCRRMPPKMNKTFIDALREKYCATVQNIKTQHYEIVFQGRPKSADANSGELGYLRNVVLNDRKIARCGLSGSELTLLCPNVLDLDLSGNLLESWEEVLPVVAQLPMLKFLNLTRNRIKNNKGLLQSWNQTLPSVENLVLNMTQIKWSDVLDLARLMPGLKELHICTNGYTKLPDMDFSGLGGLECLRLNNNKIENWDEIWKLRHLSSLQSLILSGNPLIDIYFHDKDADLDLSCSCHCHGNSNHGDENGNDTAGSKTVKDWNGNNESSAGNGNKNDSSQQKGDLDLDDMAVGNFCKQILDDVVQKLHLQENQKFVSDDKKPSTMSTEDDKPSQCQQSNLEFRLTQSEFKQNENNKQTTEAELQKGDNSSDDGSAEGSCKCECQSLNLAEVKKSKKAFRNLNNLCVSETAVSKWKHLTALGLFPSLKSLRIKDIKLASKLPGEDRRKLFVASLPNISTLNGSEVTATERDKSERHYVRYFMNKRLKPDKYASLEQKHGKLSPLVDIDLRAGFQEWATLSFVYKGETVFSDKIRMVESVGKLRLHVAQKLFLFASFKTFRLFLKRCAPSRREQTEEEGSELEELFLDLLPMSRFNIIDGDEIHIDAYDGFEEGFLKFIYIKTFLF